MTKPKIYGTKISPPVRTCLLTAAEIELDYDFVPIDVHNREHLTEDYLKKNPQHTFPVLEDDGKFIWDSHAIIAFLVEKYAKDDSLYPKDLYKRAIVDQRLHFDSGILFPRLAEAFRPINKLQRSTVPQNVIESTIEAYDFVENFLTGNKYMVGNSITIADFSMLATLSTMFILIPPKQGQHLNLINWYKRMENLPYYNHTNGRAIRVVSGWMSDKIKELKLKNL